MISISFWREIEFDDGWLERLNKKKKKKNGTKILKKKCTCKGIDLNVVVYIVEEELHFILIVKFYCAIYFFRESKFSMAQFLFDESLIDEKTMRGIINLTNKYNYIFASK